MTELLKSGTYKVAGKHRDYSLENVLITIDRVLDQSPRKGSR